MNPTNTNTNTLVYEAELIKFKDALHYLHVEELKEVCTNFELPQSGKKPDLIDRIMTWVETKTVKQHVVGFPTRSTAEKNRAYPLRPETLILFGSYKNDARTRDFFIKLIGPHFHFTAFGQDWIKDRWMLSQPPTYAEFAHYWQEEHLRRKGKKSPLKQEWAYLNFIRRYTTEHPDAPQDAIMAAWEKERTEQVKAAHAFLAKLTATTS